MNEVADQLQHVHTVTNRLEKQYDGLDLDNQKFNADEFSKKYDEIQKQLDKVRRENAEKDEMLERLKTVESEIARGAPGLADDKFEKEYKHAITKYLRKGIAPPDEMVDALCRKNTEYSLYGAEETKFNLVHKDLLASVGPEVGYFILPDRAASMVERFFETSPLRPLANVVTTTSDMYEQIVDDGEFASGWVGETQDRAKTDTSEIALIKIPVNEMYAKPYATQKSLDDVGFDLEGWVMRKIGDKFSRDEAYTFISGTGSEQPRGILDYPRHTAYPDTYERGKIGTRESTASASVTVKDLIDFQADLLEPYQANARFAMHRRTFAHIASLDDSQGRPIIDPNLLRTGNVNILLGMPVVMMADIPPIAANNPAIFYADFRQFYTIVDRFGIRMLRDPYSDKPYIQFYTTRRVGGAVTNFDAGKIMTILP